MEKWMEMEGFIVKLMRMKVLSCEKCPRAFTDENILRQHYEHHDLEDQLYQGRLKEHILSSKVVLQRVSIYRCNKCTRGFLNYLHLNNHQNEHSKRFKNTLAELENNNVSLKPHCCSECGLRFVASSTLATHAQVHRPPAHPCQCGVGFRLLEDLIMHTRLVHLTDVKSYPKHNGLVKRMKKKAKVRKTLPKKSKKDANETVNKTLPQKKTKIKKIVVKIGVNKTPAQKKTKSKKEDKKPKGKGIKKTVSQNSTKRKEKSQVITKKPGYEHKRNKGIKKECGICNETFMDLTELIAHRAIHKMKGTAAHVCRTCGSSFDTKAKLIVHGIRHRPRKPGEHIIWNCDTCNAVFKQDVALQTHLLIHTGEKPHTCHLCPKAFTQHPALKEHLKVHNKVYVCKCEFCHKKFKARAAMNLHLRTHTGYKPYVCPYCNKSFADPSAFKRHKRIHTGEKPYACPYCPKAFSDYSAYTVHKRRHEGKLPCPHCQKKYANNYLNIHIKAVHLKIGAMECAICNKTCVNKIALQQHIEAVHNKRKRYECGYCSKLFYLKHALGHHVKVKHQLTTKEFMCEICDRMFTAESNKNHHIKHVHCKLGANFVCDYCQYRFPLKKYLMNHIVQFHLGRRCQKCSKAFSTSSALRKHRCIMCSICGLYFISESLRKQHMCKHEGDNQTGLDTKILPLKIDTNTNFICHHCNQDFSTKKTLETHIWTAHLVCMYCNICMKRFYAESEFIRHKKFNCAKVKCELCDDKFSSKLLKSHIEGMHKIKTEIEALDENPLFLRMS